MKLHIFICILMVILVSDVQADYNFSLNFKAISLSENFAKDPPTPINLSSVKRYDYDLDSYKDIMLKQYKNLIFKHIDDLVSLKNNIVESYRIKKISNKIYKEHDKFSGQCYYINNFLITGVKALAFQFSFAPECLHSLGSLGMRESMVRQKSLNGAYSNILRISA